MSNRDIIDVSEPQGGNVLRFTVPGPVRGKDRARGKFGQALPYTPKPTILFENLIKTRAIDAGAVIVEGALVLIVRQDVEIPKSVSQKRRADMLAGREIPTKKPDADNVLKAVMDALNKVAWGDDAQVAIVGYAKRWALAPSLHIEVKSWRPA